MKAVKFAFPLSPIPLLVGLITTGICALACGQSAFSTVKYFGFAEFSANSPLGGLVEGTNGTLYGVTMMGGENGDGTVFKMSPDGTVFLVLKAFGGRENGRIPAGTLALPTNGVLFGTTSMGGTSNLGTIFRMNQDGAGYEVLKSFTGTNGDGATPRAGLLVANNGILYGTTSAGGTHNMGTIFSIQLDGTGYSVIRSFAGGTSDGAVPYSSLIQAADGALYGTTEQGGSQNQGTVFAISPDGSSFRLLRSFSGGTGDGAQPYSPLVQAADGTLFGTTYAGGAGSKGTVYRIAPDGSAFLLLKSFGGTSGANPLTPLVLGTNGLLYGTTWAGGSSTNGVIFQMNQDGTGFSVLKTYSATAAEGARPNAPLLQLSNGLIYGTTSGGGNYGDGTAFALNPNDSSYTVLRHFNGTGGDGTSPCGDLVEGSDGAIYGVTKGGGAWEQGTVYRMNKNGGSSVVLKSFTGTNGDGCLPSAGLLQATNGVLYGTTMYDSQYQSGSSTFVRGYGTVFKVNPDGSSYQVLKNFTGTPDAGNPYGSLMQASNGVLCGTTMSGGSKGVGTVFKINQDGSGYGIIKNFQDVGTSDGARPYAGLIQGFDGAMYGTTSVGGTASRGTVFKLNADGSGYAVLKRFTGSDGATPWAPLLQGRDNVLYGTTVMGGANNRGTVFRINPDGTDFAVLKSFAGTDGDGPVGTLAQAPNGTLYGTTRTGGAATFMLSVGTVFQLRPDGGGFCVLKTFPEDAEGYMPNSGLLSGSDGALYGATENGGRGGLGYGTVFSLVPAPVLLAPTPGTAGCQVRFLALPGRTYSIQRASSANGEWNKIGTGAADPTGVGNFVDVTPGSGSAFYRTCFP